MTIMPLFLRLQEPSKREKLILGGAASFRHRRHRLPTMATSLVRRQVVKTSAPKRHRGVVARRRHRPPSKKQQQRKALPLHRKKRQQQQQSKHSNVLSMVKKTGQRTVQALQKKLVPSTAKNVLNQLANSREIKRAVKNVVVQNRDLPAAAATGAIKQVVKAVARSKKRLAPDDEETPQPPTTKRARVAPGFSRLGYRGKKLLQGGTRQQYGGGQFLF